MFNAYEDGGHKSLNAPGRKKLVFQDKIFLPGNKHMETIKILEQIISIPSWVDTKTNEKEIGKWIHEFLKRNSKLDISKQSIGNGRSNILAQKGSRVDTLVTGHIDTVQISSGWTQNAVKAKVIGDKMFGLGSSDMKCGIATMLYLTTLTNLNNNILFLFYCDEEYNFLGMKKFIERFKNRINPKLIISLDGGGMQIGNSCRGLIEMRVKVIGTAGHSANPKSGVNAITESMRVIRMLGKYLKDFSSKELGNSTLNIAYINGGGTEGNIIAEQCEYVVEVRVANEKLNADIVKECITENSKKLGLKIKEIKVRHNLGAWITRENELENFISISPKKKLAVAKKSGYIDIQMLWKVFGKIPTFSFGAGESGQAHKADEFVKVSSVMAAQKFFQTILTDRFDLVSKRVGKC